MSQDRMMQFKCKGISPDPEILRRARHQKVKEFRKKKREDAHLEGRKSFLNNQKEEERQAEIEEELNEQCSNNLKQLIKGIGDITNTNLQISALEAICILLSAQNSCELMESNFLIALIKSLQQNQYPQLQKAVIAVLKKWLACGKTQILPKFIELNVIKHCCKLFQSKIPQMLVEALKLLQNILEQSGEEFLEKIISEIKKCGGYKKVSELQHHGSHQVYELAHKITKEFFSDQNIEKHTELTIWKK